MPSGSCHASYPEAEARSFKGFSADIGIDLSVIRPGLVVCNLSQPDWVRTCRYTVENEKQTCDGMVKIAHLSDLHPERGSERRFARALETLKREKPDIIVLTGDYLNDQEASSVKLLGRFISGLVAIAPAFAVEGNWETPEINALVASGGAQFLQEEAVDLQIQGISMCLNTSLFPGR